MLADQLTRRMKLVTSVNDDEVCEPASTTTNLSLPTMSGRPSVLYRKQSPEKKSKIEAFNPKLYLLSLHSTHILPDVEISSTSVARSLLPIMRKLKWCLQRDRLAREFKRCGKAAGAELGIWLSEGEGEMIFDDYAEEKRMRKRIFGDGEKVRFALCPDVKKMVGFFEKLGHGDTLVG